MDFSTDARCDGCGDNTQLRLGAGMRNTNFAKMMKWISLAVFFAVFLLGASTSRATDTDKEAITKRLEDWAAAFNRRDADGACDLFAQDLVSTVPGALEAGKDAVCARLAKVLSKTDVSLQYRPDIREIIVSGDTAAVRLFWILTTEKGGAKEESTEAGIDIFQRQTDGRWSIARFIAFTIDPGDPF